MQIQSGITTDLLSKQVDGPSETANAISLGGITWKYNMFTCHVDVPSVSHSDKFQIWIWFMCLFLDRVTSYSFLRIMNT